MNNVIPLYNPYGMAGGNPYQQQYQQPQQYTNMLPIGSYNYNNTAFANATQQPQQMQPQQQYIFTPVCQNNYGYNNMNPYSNYNPQLQYAGMQPQQQYYQQPTYDNPYPYMQQPQQMYGYNPLSQPYYGYRPFISMQQQEAMLESRVSMSKAKYAAAMTFLGQEIDQRAADLAYNPRNPMYQLNDDDMADNYQWHQFMNYINNTKDIYECDNIITRMSNDYWQRKINYGKEFDNRSLCEFLEEDYHKINREFWIAENIKKGANGRNLSTTYDSKEYNELLKMHQSSNPYIKELLDDSRYDNNIDDFEMGVKSAIEHIKSRNRKFMFEQPLPTTVSPADVQQRRALFTQEILNNTLNRGNKNV